MKNAILELLKNKQYKGEVVTLPFFSWQELKKDADGELYHEDTIWNIPGRILKYTVKGRRILISFKTEDNCYEGEYPKKYLDDDFSLVYYWDYKVNAFQTVGDCHSIMKFLKVSYTTARKFWKVLEEAEYKKEK